MVRVTSGGYFETNGSNDHVLVLLEVQGCIGEGMVFLIMLVDNKRLITVVIGEVAVSTGVNNIDRIVVLTVSTDLVVLSIGSTEG